VAEGRFISGEGWKNIEEMLRVDWNQEWPLQIGDSEIADRQ
jgi:hypothetical protein